MRDEDERERRQGWEIGRRKQEKITGKVKPVVLCQNVDSSSLPKFNLTTEPYQTTN
jgi:hypothetical protein